MFRTSQLRRSASIRVQIVLALLFAAFSAGCADTPSPMAQPTSTPSADTIPASAVTPLPMAQPTSTPSADTIPASSVTPSPTAQPTSTPSADTIPASAVTVSVGETVNGSLADDDRDSFHIRGEENFVYDLSVAPGTLTAPIVVLYAFDLSRMIESRGHPATGEVQFVWPGYPTDFYVTVEGGDGGGSYTLTLLQFPEDHGSTIPFASPVSLGETVRGSIGYSADFDYFRFSAAAGQLYQIALAPSNEGCWTMRLEDSNAEVLAYRRFPELIVWEAQSSGDYYIEVMKGFYPGCDYSWEGEYTLTVTPMSLPPEDEHGNGVMSAASIGVGEPVVAGLEYTGDSDYFRFRAEKGRIYRMDVDLGTLDSYSYEINLYGPEGNEIEEWGYHQLRSSGNAWEAPADGEYYVAIVHSGNETGSYTLTVTLIADDHGDDPASATEVTLGETIRGNTQYIGERDYFRFRAEKGQFFRINTEVPPAPYDQWLIVRLKDAKGHEVWPWGKTWEAPETGDFYLDVGYNISIGSYTLTVAQTPPPPGDDHGNYVTAATPIVVGETVNGSVDYEGDVDYFRFTADRDQPFRIEIESRDMDHWHPYLYDANGRLLEDSLHRISEEPRGWFTRWFSWKAPLQGVYYISASGWDRTGAYTLTIVALTDDHGDSATSATALVVGKSVGGNIDYQGDTDYIKFRAQGGHTYRIEVSPDTLPGATLTLYDSAAQALAVGWDRVNIGCSDCGEDWAKDARRPIIWEAPTSGDYYVKVEARLETVGSYELAIDRFTE